MRISVEAFTPISAVTPALPGFPLAQAREPLSAAQIAGCMAALGGDTFQATSRQGRPVLGTYLRGPGPAVFISGAQHANENLRRGRRCARRRRWPPAARATSR